MSLVVPALRISMLFLNVFETFKTLKQPPPSKRNGGQPSVRALTQRKRNMKGCLAIWIVWCCFAVYERTLDSIVGIFIPFYTEVKSIALLFLLITRARGAEPIYLHVLRPLIKPHTTALDSLLDFTNVLGEFLFVFLTLPIRFVLSWWWRSSSLHGENTMDLHYSSSIHTTRNLEASELSHSESYSVTSESIFYTHTGVRSRPNGLRMTPNGNGRRFSTGRYSSADLSRGTVRTRRHAPPGTADAQLRHASDPNPQRLPIPDIWYPPPSAYIEDDTIVQPDLSSNPNTRPNISPESPPSFDLLETELVDEWRLYPPFPSAYPPTPLPAASKLPPSAIISPQPRRPSDTIHFPAISEDQEQGFHSSLLHLREPMNPGSSASSSDDDRMHGVQDGTGALARNRVLVPVDIENDENDGDGEDEDEDDPFDVTLGTPLPPFGGLRSRVRTMSSPLVSSVPTSPTALTTLDDGSSLRTRTTSESSASVSLSDSSSVAGQKRALPLSNVVDAQSRSGAFDRTVQTPSVDVPTRSTTTPRPTGMSGLTTEESTVTSDTADEDEQDEDGSDGARQVGIKRRRVLGTLPGSSQASTRNFTATVKERAKGNTTTKPLVPSRTSSRLANSRSGATGPHGSRRTAYVAPPSESSSITEKGTRSKRSRK